MILWQPAHTGLVACAFRRSRAVLYSGLFVSVTRSKLTAAGGAGTFWHRSTSRKALPRKVGELLQTRLAELVDRYELLHEVRGRGLMIGIEFGRPSSWKRRAPWAALQLARKGLFAQTVVHALFHRHRILTQVSGDHVEVIKLIPPLTIGEAEVDRFVDAFVEVMDDAHRGTPLTNSLTRDFGTMLVRQTRSS